MKKNSIKERAKSVPPEIKRMVRRSMAVSAMIVEILDRKQMDQKSFAKLLNKSESEVSKWLRGSHNFTFKTICKIEEVLGEPIIFTADEAEREIYVLNYIENKETVLCIPAGKHTYTSFGKQTSFGIQVSAIVQQEGSVTLSECQTN